MTRFTTSPWGKPQHVEQLADGIWYISTASHGGIYIDQERLAELYRVIGTSYVPTWVGSQHWYEEDCDASLPALVLLRDQLTEEQTRIHLATLSRRADNEDGHACRLWTNIRDNVVAAMEVRS